MAKRATNHKKRPGTSWDASMEQLNSTTLYLLARTGPTVFSVRDEEEKIYKISIGNPHGCTCGLHNSDNLCIHLMYILLKVLKVPATHELSYQTSLTDPEVTQVLSGSCSASNRSLQARNNVAAIRQQRDAARRRGSQGNSAGEENKTSEDGFVPRQVLDEEDAISCPICQDDMTKEQALTWCRKGCGNNMHAKCMQTYAQYKTSNREPVGCPLCREDWALDLLKDDCRGRASLKNSCAPIYCSTCTFPLRGDFHRCIECSQIAAIGMRKPVDFCMRCFPGISREHTTHHFITSDAGIIDIRDITWTPVLNPRTPSRILEPEILATLQQRELGTEDYDLLLGLDKQGPPDLSTQLLQSLPEEKAALAAANAALASVSGGDMTAAFAVQPQMLKCWCRRVRSEDIIRVLPCKHTCHESCLQTKLLEILSDGTGCGLGTGLLSLLCIHHNCNVRIFPGLIRRRKKKRSNSNDSNASTPPSTASSINGQSSACLTGPTTSSSSSTTGIGTGLGGLGSLSVNGIATSGGIRGGSLRLGSNVVSQGSSTENNRNQHHRTSRPDHRSSASLSLSATPLNANTSNVGISSGSQVLGTDTTNMQMSRQSTLVGFGSRTTGNHSTRRQPVVEHDTSSFQALSIGISSNGLASIANESSLSSQPQPHIYENHRKVTNVGRLQRPPRPRLRVLSTLEHETDRIGEVGTVAGMSVGVGVNSGTTMTNSFESNNQSLATTRMGMTSCNMSNGPITHTGTGTIPQNGTSIAQNSTTTHALARQRRLETSRSACTLVTSPLEGNNPNGIHNMDINGQRLGVMSSGGRSQSHSNDLLVGSGLGTGTSSTTTSGLGGIRAAAAASTATMGNASRSHQRRRIASIGHGLGGSNNGGSGNGGGSGMITNGGGSAIGIGIGTSQSAVGNMLRDAVIADALIGQGLGTAQVQGLGQAQGLGPAQVQGLGPGSPSATGLVNHGLTTTGPTRRIRGGLTLTNHGSSPSSPTPTSHPTSITTLALHAQSISPTYVQVALSYPPINLTHNRILPHHTLMTNIS